MTACGNSGRCYPVVASYADLHFAPGARLNYRPVLQTAEPVTAESSDAGARFICPVTAMPAGRPGLAFCALLPCGHVIAERCLREVLLFIFCARLTVLAASQAAHVIAAARLLCLPFVLVVARYWPAAFQPTRCANRRSVRDPALSAAPT